MCPTYIQGTHMQQAEDNHYRHSYSKKENTRGKQKSLVHSNSEISQENVRSFSLRSLVLFLLRNNYPQFLAPLSGLLLPSFELSFLCNKRQTMFRAIQCSEPGSCQQNVGGPKAFSFCKVSLNFRPCWWCSYQYNALKNVFCSHVNIIGVHFLRQKPHPPVQGFCWSSIIFKNVCLSSIIYNCQDLEAT